MIPTTKNTHDTTTLYTRTDLWGWKSTSTTGCGNTGFASFDEAMADAWRNRTPNTNSILIGGLCRVGDTADLMLWEPALVKLSAPGRDQDIELEVLSEAFGLLKQLDEEPLARVFQWLHKRLGIHISWD